MNTKTQRNEGDVGVDITALTSTETEESLQVTKIWSQKDSTDFILGCVYGIRITDRDIRSLQSTEWLTDQVIDAYLKMLCQAELDKGKPVLHIPTIAMTSILTGRSNKESPFFPKHLLTSYEVLLGAYNQNLSHWILVVLEPSKGLFYYFDPFGADEIDVCLAVHNWSKFLNGRPMEKRISWEVESKEHMKQTDWYNCGVFCLMFAERFLTQKPLTGVVSTRLEKERRSIAEKLLQYEIYIKHACPCCGHEILSHEKVPCISCGRNFHKKSFCVGEKYIKDEVVHILCRGCNQEMLVDNAKSDNDDASLTCGLPRVNSPNYLQKEVNMSTAKSGAVLIAEEVAKAAAEAETSVKAAAEAASQVEAASKAVAIAAAQAKAAAEAAAKATAAAKLAAEAAVQAISETDTASNDER